MKTIAVIGAGIMGHGIAQAYAEAGKAVWLYDLELVFLDKAINEIRKNLALKVEEKLLTLEEAEKAMSHIQVTTDLKEAVWQADFIIEVIPENLEMKWALFSQLEELAARTAVIASNTSTFSIGRLIEKSQTTNRMLITHFFNPAHLVPLVEVVKHPETDDEVVSRTVKLLDEIGKKPIVLKKDVPGLIANRLQAALAREAFSLLENGVAAAEDIDTAITSGPGFRWSFIGPIETADFGGLDIWEKVIGNLAPDLDKGEDAPSIIKKYVQEGRLGTKTGKGIFSYRADSVKEKTRERDIHLIRLLKVKAKLERL